MKNLSNFGIYNFIYDLHEKFINEKTFLNILEGNPKLFHIVHKETVGGNNENRVSSK